MNAPLFRPEVVQARRQDWLGRISLAQPMPVWVGAVFALLAAGAVACLLLFGEYAHRSRVGGQLVPDLGVSTVVAPTSGMVGRMTVEEGASVARDQALVRIDLPRVAASGADAHTGKTADEQQADQQRQRQVDQVKACAGFAYTEALFHREGSHHCIKGQDGGAAQDEAADAH